MSMVDGCQLVQLRQLADPATTYLTCMDLIGRLASKGLVHCDFNEFNLLIGEQGEVTLIDFPQMVSTSHANAKELFERDVECVIRYVPCSRPINIAYAFAHVRCVVMVFSSHANAKELFKRSVECVIGCEQRKSALTFLSSHWRCVCMY